MAQTRTSFPNDSNRDSESSLPLLQWPRSFGQTGAKTAGGSRPCLFSGLGGFVVYSTWAAFQGAHYRGAVSFTIYSPEIFGDAQHSWLGAKPGWWPMCSLVAGAADPVGARRVSA